jgi:putative transcriptional regulator
MKLARIVCDLSQEQLAEKIGVTRQTISLIESGNYNPTIKLCILICKALNTTLDQLFWDNDNSTNI